MARATGIGQDFRSVAELEQAIADCIEEHNEDPKPFAWTKTVELTFDKITESFG